MTGDGAEMSRRRFRDIGRLLAGVLAAAAVVFVGPSSRAEAAVVDVYYVVDGDTIRLDSGTYVRLIGIDTPEVGECGYGKAKRQLDAWIGDRARLVNPASVDDRDAYDRLLRYVHASGRDTGLALIRKGLAKARYDGRDGYDHHPRQRLYRRADRRSEDVC
jgi:endonuclease YncB( thermonuclease family)